MIHELKIQPQYYHDVKCGIKRFELRKDDRNYNIGDYVILKEYDNGVYTGNETKPMEILYILRNCPEYGLKEGYCILGLKGVKE